jgi:hypothetical protein
MADAQHEVLQRHIRILLQVAFRHTVRADDAEQAFACVEALAGEPMQAALFHDAVAACLHDGVIREPVRLPAGRLQCHWRLELTPEGVARVRDLAASTRAGR